MWTKYIHVYSCRAREWNDTLHNICHGGGTVTKSCPTLATPWTLACQAPLSMVFSRARILEWVAISFSRGSSRPRNQTRVSCPAGRFFTNWAMREDQHMKLVTDPGTACFPSLLSRHPHTGFLASWRSPPALTCHLLLASDTSYMLSFWLRMFYPLPSAPPFHPGSTLIKTFNT